MKTDVANYVKNCGICNRVEKFNASSEMGNSKVRCYKAYQPFSHISVDPLGYVKVKIGRKVYKNYPFIIVDVNLGFLDIKILQTL